MNSKPKKKHFRWSISGSVVFATVPASSINSWESWFIFNLRKYTTISNVHRFPGHSWCQGTLRKLHDIIRVWTHDYDLYILEQPSSWSTSRIRPSWPRSRLRLSLLLAYLSTCVPCCHASLGILLFVPNGSGFALNSFIAIWVASHKCTSKQHNNAIWHTWTPIYTYIISALLFFFLPFVLHLFHLSWQAGWPRHFWFWYKWGRTMKNTRCIKTL